MVDGTKSAATYLSSCTLAGYCVRSPRAVNVDKRVEINLRCMREATQRADADGSERERRGYLVMWATPSSIRQSEGGSGNETGKEIRLPRGLHPGPPPYEPKCILSNSSGTCLQSSA